MKLSRNTVRVLAVTLIAGSSLFIASCGQKKVTEATNAAAATTAAPIIKETEAPTEPVAEITAPPGTEKEAESSSGKLKTSIEKYEMNGISIEYPVVSGMSNSSQQDKLNDHLKENALAIIKNYPDSKEPLDQDQDTLDVKCTVVSADSGRVTVTYEGYYNMKGAAHPNNLFYTNTVDVKSLKDISLKDAADPYTMAAYALSDEVAFKAVNQDAVKALTEALKSVQKDMSIEQYQECLEKADFPLKKGSDGKTITWPASFSYESEGTLYYSIPVPHVLGDYIIVEYDITTK
ncbi:MAG: DUF4163 domain-containing protein [Stomatobaculum sp.]|nr:DUF4163 domain-containing protein [Stomatobaculum sp.]